MAQAIRIVGGNDRDLNDLTDGAGVVLYPDVQQALLYLLQRCADTWDEWDASIQSDVIALSRAYANRGYAFASESGNVWAVLNDAAEHQAHFQDD